MPLIKDLKIRSLTGLALAALVYLLISAGPWSYFVLTMLINIGGLNEFYGLNKLPAVRPMKTEAILLSLLLLLTVFLTIKRDQPPAILLINLLPAWLLFIRELYRQQAFPMLNLAVTFMGVVYVTIPLCFLLALPFSTRSLIYQGGVPLGFFIILWLADSGAYLGGRLIGRHHLFERISPGKTWEGSAVGALCAIAASFANHHFFPFLSLRLWMYVAFIVIVAGSYGDLVKSMLKRSANVKDAGNILPGHGGILDRFDSLLGSAPFVFTCIWLFR
ncbi:MAG: phosphatidate cytidylyltransferase [Mucilaginibacter sp.]